jgi:amino acid transporter
MIFDKYSIKHIFLVIIILITFIKIFVFSFFYTNELESVDNKIKFSQINFIFLFYSLLIIPISLCNLFGLILFDLFPNKKIDRRYPLFDPFLCFRVVTRGNYPDLIKENVRKNLELCIEQKLENFIIEVVSDMEIS